MILKVKELAGPTFACPQYWRPPCLERWLGWPATYCHLAGNDPTMSVEVEGVETIDVPHSDTPKRILVFSPAKSVGVLPRYFRVDAHRASRDCETAAGISPRRGGDK